MGPSVQGSSISRAARIRLSATIATAFIAGATLFFALVHVLSRWSGLAEVSAGTRAGAGAVGLLLLAALDVRARSRRTYCPVGPRRQTPKSLIHRRSPTFVAAAWGLDIGLAFTTIRVTALTWGAALLAALGLSGLFAGLWYGLAFAIPFVLLLWTHRVGRASRSPVPIDPGLESMLARRGALQAGSAALLAASALVLIVVA